MAADDAHTRGVPALGDTSAELGALVRGWRRRLRPEDIPGFAAYPARRRDQVSQDDVARLIGSTSYWYGELERGRQGGYSNDFLNRAANALRLSDAERWVLYQYAVGREPQATYTPSTEVAETTRTILDALPVPAYLSDLAWDVLYSNQHVGDWFPWMPNEPNVMRWTFTYPEARTQLVNWSTDWGPPMVAQMRLVHARFPDNERLNGLIEEILDVNEDARRLWEDDPTVKSHADGDQRQMYVPYRPEPITVEIQIYAPHRDATQRLVLLVPLSNDANPGITIVKRQLQETVYPAGPAGEGPDS